MARNRFWLGVSPDSIRSYSHRDEADKARHARDASHEQPRPATTQPRPSPAQAKSVKYLTLGSNNGGYVNLWLPF